MITKVRRWDVFYAVARDNKFVGKQKVTDWYWDCGGLVFCTNKQTHETEHYTVEDFVRHMSNFFAIDLGCDKIDFDSKTDSFVFGVSSRDCQSI